MRPLGSPRAGQLLISATSGVGGYFERCVILLLEHNQSGAVGVVLNHPTSHPLPDQLSHLKSYVSPPAVLFSGGPVAEDALLGLGQLAVNVSNPPGWKQIFDDVGLVDLNTPQELFTGTFSHLRLFSALCGWDAGQLTAEIVRGAWIRAEARAEEVFSISGDLWRRVLRRLGGNDALLSTWTPAPSLN